MRTLYLVPLLSTIALLSLAVPAHANDWTIESFKTSAKVSDWEGYAVGTSVTTSKSSVSPMGKRDSVERQTITKIDEKNITIKTEKQAADGTWSELSSKAVPRKKNVKFEMKAPGEAIIKIKVGETSYDCKIVEGTKIEDGKSEKARFWVHAKHGVLQMEMPGGPGMTITLTATRIGVEKTIGSVTFTDCREFAATIPGAGKMKMLISLKCPENTLVQDMTMEQQGMKMSNSEIVTAVKLKKKAAVTTK